MEVSHYDACMKGREKIVDFLTRKWEREHGYQLKKTLWCFGGNRIAVRFQYEWHDDKGQWYRAEGNEVDFPPECSLTCIVSVIYYPRWSTQRL